MRTKKCWLFPAGIWYKGETVLRWKGYVWLKCLWFIWPTDTWEIPFKYVWAFQCVQRMKCKESQAQTGQLKPDARVCVCDCPSYFHLSPFSILFTCCPSFTGQFSVSCICSLSNPFPNISAFLFPALIFMYFGYFVFFLCPVSGFRSFQMLTQTTNTQKKITFSSIFFLSFQGYKYGHTP